MFLSNSRWIARVVLMAAIGLLPAVGVAAERVLVDFPEHFDVASVEAQDAKVSQSGTGLKVTTGRKGQWPGITLKAPGGHWDLSDCGHVVLVVKNAGSRRAAVSCRVDNPGADGKQNCVTGSVEIGPGEQQTLRAALQRKMPPELRGKLFGMRGYPGGWSESQGIDPGNVTQLLVFVAKPTEEHLFTIGEIRAGGEPPAVSADPAKLFPMIDSFGQYMHKDWPGKTKSAEDLTRCKEVEAADLAAHAGPNGWNEYGGWQAGPQLKASGFFRAEKHGGKWWLVDPEGRLFWSHGIDCVRPANASTPITDREKWFADLPQQDSPLGQFYGKARGAAHGYYQDKRYETFNFTGANLLRKYGAEWKTQYAELAHRRLRSWGMNTIANWSDPEIYRLKKTPYTATVQARGKAIQGSEGYWGKFEDVFDPEFAASLRRAMAGQKNSSAGDPWCIGYFVGNELSWGNETSLAVAALGSPPEQAAKKVFIEDLQQKYRTIERLNQAWGTEHASWDALLKSTTPPEVKKARDDLAAFYTKTAEQYFRICREAVKEAAPNQLYLGCRFAWANDLAIRAAAKYCDVVSFNRYRRGLSDLRLPEGVDKPVIIGEFHFGALDRGMFHTGLVPTASQQDRAAAYAAYVRGAIDNPLIVGTHWFQYGDQATTGRSDGENYQIGFLDVCDTPYGETIQASREVGAEMYRRRIESANPPAVLVEAEQFENLGGWVVDPQFMDQMGSPYLLAHGLGVPVADAVTRVEFPATGSYRVLVRTRDWVAPWKAPGAPGRFQVLINGRPLATVFGTKGAAWHWEDGGAVVISEKKATLALNDLTGFEGRCDAIVFAAEAGFVPPSSDPEMAAFRRRALKLPEKPEDGGTFDLVVVGGGIAGTCAALTAARLDLKVALIQDRPVLGGNNSSEVRVWLQGARNVEPYARLGDVVEELEQQQRAHYGPTNTAELYEDQKKLALVKAEPNIALLLQHRANAVEMDGSRLQAVVAQHIINGRRLRVCGRWFADCTGDGCIGFLAGADHDVTTKGHLGTCNLWHVKETSQPVEFPRCPWALDLSHKPFPGRGQGKPDPLKLGGWYWESGFDHDPIEPGEYVRDWNLRAMYGAWDALKNVDKVLPNHELHWAAYISGKRESRRLLGDVILSKEDLLQSREYTDGCVPTGWTIDLHSPDQRYEQGFAGDAFIAKADFGKYPMPYWVPYRCLYSRNVANLFMAGRDISVTHEALGAVRVMRTGGLMGEVVGMAASLCRKHGADPRGVYQTRLEELQGLMRRGARR